jgi:hypothetical protein
MRGAGGSHGVAWKLFEEVERQGNVWTEARAWQRPIFLVKLGISRKRMDGGEACCGEWPHVGMCLRACMAKKSRDTALSGGVFDKIVSCRVVMFVRQLRNIR